MAKDQGAIRYDIRPRGAPKPSARAAVVAAPPKKPFDPIKFYNEVRAEARKVTWTSWKETWITSVMVGIMVVVTALFFFSVDGVFGLAMNWILKLTAEIMSDTATHTSTRHKWYIVHAYSNFEKKVAEAIREQAHDPGPR